MLDFQVKGMSCGHCEAAVTRAVRAVDPAAKVTVDRGAGRVVVGSSADADALQRAIEAEGYGVSRRS